MRNLSFLHDTPVSKGQFSCKNLFYTQEYRMSKSPQVWSHIPARITDSTDDFGNRVNFTWCLLQMITALVTLLDSRHFVSSTRRSAETKYCHWVPLQVKENNKIIKSDRRSLYQSNSKLFFTYDKSTKGIHSHIYLNKTRDTEKTHLNRSIPNAISKVASLSSASRTFKNKQITNQAIAE